MSKHSLANIHAKEQKFGVMLKYLFKSLPCVLWGMDVFLMLKPAVAEKSRAQVWWISQGQQLWVSKDVLMQLTWAKWNQQGSWEAVPTGEGRKSFALLAELVLWLVISIIITWKLSKKSWHPDNVFLTKSSLVPESYTNFLLQDKWMLIIMTICDIHLTSWSYK